MDKAEGVPLSQVLDTMDLTQKLRLLLAVTSLQKRWLSISFSHYGSLYYTGDVKERAGNYYAKKDGEDLNSPKFIVGPATGRDWIDADRSTLDTERGPCTLRPIQSSRIH